MVPLLLLASIPAMLTSMGSGAPDTTDQMVNASKNGEFIWRYYPPGALKRGEEGRVAFRLTIEPTGTISTCDVTESSGSANLDKETCDIMGLYARVQPVRNSDGRAIRATQNGFIVWKLPPGATKMASAATSATMPKPDQLICKREATTGSLIAKTRQCLTRTEWLRQEQNTKDEMDRLQGRGFSDCKSMGTC